MKIRELRKELEKHDNKELKDIIVYIYKLLPKRKLEDYDVDEYLTKKKEIDKKKKENIDEPISIEDLKVKVHNFIVTVDYGYYANPNKIISKTQRSNWRFTVKRFYKELNSINPNSEDGIWATDALIKLFKRLSLGTYILRFPNWNTFEALGVLQSNYYDNIINRVCSKSYSRENLKKCIDLLSVYKSSSELSINMYNVFLSYLKTTDIREITIGLLKEKIENLNEYAKKIKDSTDLYYLNENINYMVYLITSIYFKLCETDKGIKFFHKNYNERDKEVKEYQLLNIIEEFEDYKTWVKEYESKELDYRDSLKEKYIKYKELINER